MPVHIAAGEQNFNKEVLRASYNYQYPLGMTLRPLSPTHEKLKTEIYRRATESYSVMSERFDSWNLIDESLTAYIPTDTEEDEVLEKDSRKPVSIVVPYSYATLETVLTYLVAAFLQDPIFRYEGWGPNDVYGGQLLQLVIQQQCLKAKIGLNLHTMFRDALAYGIGIVAPVWREQYGFKTVVKEEPLVSLFGLNLGSTKVKETVEALLYEGNAIDNVDPYRYLPDPNYSITDVQRGDFVGWTETKSYVDLLGQERNNPQDVFNVRYLKGLSSRRSALFGTDDSNRERFKGGSSRSGLSEQVTKPVDVIHMFMKIIPKEFELKGGQFNPDGEYPEKWYFALAADEVIIECRPLGLNHDMFPLCVCAPDFDGRSTTPISRLEIVYGLQNALNFMFNSHVANVRKAVNDMFVVDPWAVNMNDIRNPKPGKFIRLRRSNFGKGVQGVIEQLKITDVTSNNVTDAARIMDIMERVSAATHNMMGVMRPGSERRSAAEFEGTQGSALNRLERIAKVIGLQAMHDIGYMFAHHTQQLMSEDTYIKVAGEWERTLQRDFGVSPQQGRLAVSPMDLLVDYDVIVRDGSVPGGNFSQAWIQVFQSVLNSEVAMSRIDVFRMFKYIARNLGAKNIDDFELKQQPQGGPIPPMNIEARPDQQVQAQAGAGMLTPMP